MPILLRAGLPDRAVGATPWARWWFLRESLVVVGALAFYTYTRFYAGAFTFFNPEGDQSALFQVLGWLILALIAAAVFVGLKKARAGRADADLWAEATDSVDR